MAQFHVLTASLSEVIKSKGWKVDDIFDNNGVFLVVSMNDASLFVLVSKMGAPCHAFLIPIINLGSFAFQALGPSMLWDSDSQIF